MPTKSEQMWWEVWFRYADWLERLDSVSAEPVKVRFVATVDVVPIDLSVTRETLKNAIRSGK